MESSENIGSSGAATRASAGAEQLAEQVRALEAALARHDLLLVASQEAEHDWERVFDAIEDPICVVTADYRLVHANAAYTKLFGPAYVRGGPLRDTIETRRTGFMQHEWWFPDGPGGAPRLRVYHRWTYPIINADGQVDRVVEVVKDVTEQEHMRQTIARTEALREADRLKAELLSTVSHELRSPLTAIKGYAATLLRHERRLPREERREFLEAIGKASDRLEVIVNRLLELSQLETGSIAPHQSPVDVAQVAREAIAVAERRAQATGPNRYIFNLRLSDTANPAEDTPGTSLLIEADPRLLRDALDNLLENAVKYSPEGGTVDVIIHNRTVRVGSGGRPGDQPPDVESTPEGPDAQQMLEIVVRDTGLGIPAEHLGRVFERFHRVDTRLTREVDGLGLGLAMCKRIAELHGGAIWAESAPGSGSAFHLLLPLTATTTTAATTMAATTATTAAAAAGMAPAPTAPSPADAEQVRSAADRRHAHLPQP